MSGSQAGPGSPAERNGSWAGTVVAVAARPWLWPTAARQVVLLAPPGWWRRPPYLPVPDAAYLAFRLETMYGGRAPKPVGRDVVGYLIWCRSYRRLLR